MTRTEFSGIIIIINENGSDEMRISEIQSVVTRWVFEWLKGHHLAPKIYMFNVHTNFFIRSIKVTDSGNLIAELNNNKEVAVSVLTQDTTYEDFIQKLFVVYHENFEERSEEKEEYIEQMLKEDEYSKIKASGGQSYRCHNCGKTFSKDMNFRVDGFNRNICPYCERRTIDIVSGEQDSFYD